MTKKAVEKKIEKEPKKDVKSETKKAVNNEPKKDMQKVVKTEPATKTKKETKKKLKLKKKTIIILSLVLITFVLFLVATTFHKSDYKKDTNVKEPEKIEQPVVEEEKEEEVNVDIIKDYEDYSNTDLVGILNVPGTEINNEPVVQYSNNEFYLNRDIHRKKDIIGTTFLDYRVDIDDSKKILIYGHNSPTLNPPFKQLEKYYNEDFAKKNRLIKLTTPEAEYTFEIFSAYIDATELHNFSYMNVNFADDETWLAHLNHLKSNSWYDFDTELNASDRILVVQTCTYHSKYKKYANKRFVLIAKQIKKVKNVNE